MEVRLSGDRSAVLLSTAPSQGCALYDRYQGLAGKGQSCAFRMELYISSELSPL